MPNYRYLENVSPQDRFQQIEILLDSGASAILVHGHTYVLSASEIARATRYVVMVPSSGAVDPLPEDGGGGGGESGGNTNVLVTVSGDPEPNPSSYSEKTIWIEVF